MTLETSHVVPAPREQVWDWHTRPGAAARLVPPFLPMVPLQQADSLATGTTIFGLPAGLRWVARHDLSRYRRGYSFADVCINSPIKTLAHWRHDHLFADHPEGTLVTDRLDTRVPSSLLEPFFIYRHNQLTEDFAFLQRMDSLASAHPAPLLSDGPGKPLTIALTGSRGTVGRALHAQLTTAGHRVIQLVRGKAKDKGKDKAQATQRTWRPSAPARDLLDGVDVVVHLAGEPIFGRFNESHKRDIRDSRVEPTRKLARLAAETPSVTSFISASAIGFYGHDRGDEVLTEQSARGDGFLADVVTQWEAAAQEAASDGLRVCCIRTGVVLSGARGMLPILKVLFSTGLGGSFGDGDFWFSWISLDDLTDIYFRAVIDSDMSGIYNATAPNPVSNREMATAIGRELGRPSLIPIPTIGPALLLGKEGAQELALADQRVIPQRLLDDAHRFRHPRMEQALAHELGGNPAG